LRTASTLTNEKGDNVLVERESCKELRDKGVSKWLNDVTRGAGSGFDTRECGPVVIPKIHRSPHRLAGTTVIKAKPDTDGADNVNPGGQLPVVGSFLHFRQVFLLHR